MNQAEGTNKIFNLQFQIPSLLQSVVKFSVWDFAFSYIYFINLLGKINFLNSRGPPGVRGPQVKNRCSKRWQCQWMVQNTSCLRIYFSARCTCLETELLVFVYFVLRRMVYALYLCHSDFVSITRSVSQRIYICCLHNAFFARSAQKECLMGSCAAPNGSDHILTKFGIGALHLKLWGEFFCGSYRSTNTLHEVYFPFYKIYMQRSIVRIIGTARAASVETGLGCAVTTSHGTHARDATRRSARMAVSSASASLSCATGSKTPHVLYRHQI
jgi:hypothetical protein